MPIYEYLCRDCNTIFQFLVRVTSTHSPPLCPECGSGPMDRVMSSFSLSRASSSQDDFQDLEGLDTEDPREMARSVRRMAEEMGEELEPEVRHALERLEAGEDPDSVERDLEASGLDGSSSPRRAEGLYEG